MREKIKNILETHNLMRIGTLDQNNMPNVRSVDFANDQNDESKIYFTTFSQSQKVNEIEKNNRVYVVVDKDANTIEELAKIKYLRGIGYASKVVDPLEMKSAMELLIKKYPFLTQLPGDPSMMSCFRIDLDEVDVTDNSVAFGHVDHFKY